jgi:hypothetical protein
MTTALVHRSSWSCRTPIRPLALACLLCLPVARAELLFYEGFDYPVAEKLGESSSVTNWENSKTTVSIVSGNLDYEGLKAPTGNRLYVQSSSPSLDGVRTAPDAWAEQFGGTLYVSFVLRLRSIAGISSTGEGTSLLTISHQSNSSIGRRAGQFIRIFHQRPRRQSLPGRRRHLSDRGQIRMGRGRGQRQGYPLG